MIQTICTVWCWPVKSSTRLARKRWNFADQIELFLSWGWSGRPLLQIANVAWLVYRWLATSSQRGKVELLRVDICKQSYKSWIWSSSSQGANAACREFPRKSNRISAYGKSSEQRHEEQTATYRVEVCWYRRADCYSSRVCWTQTRGWELHMIPSRVTYVPSATVVTGSMTTGRFSDVILHWEEVIYNHSKVVHIGLEFNFADTELNGSDVHLLTLISGSKPDELGFVRVEFQSVGRHPGVDISNAFRDPGDHWFRLTSPSEQVELPIVGVKVCFNTVLWSN